MDLLRNQTGLVWKLNMDNITDEDLYKLLEFINETRINLSKYMYNALQDETWKMFIVTLCTVVVVVGFILNSFVFTVIVKYKQLHTVTNIFIATLALSDIMLCIFNLPLQLHYQVTSSWSFGPVLCRIFMPLFSVPIFFSPAAMLMIAIDRYILIVHPHMRRMTNKTAISSVIAILILTICFAIPLILHVEFRQVDIPEFNFHHTYCLELWHTSYDTYLIYNICVFFFSFAIPLITIAILYFRIYLVLKNRPRQESMRNQKTNKILVAIVLLFIIFWLPWNLYGLILRFNGYLRSFVPYIQTTDLLLKIIALSSACINPYLYGWLNDNFRKVLENMFNGKLKQFKCCGNGCAKTEATKLDMGLTTSV